MFSVFSRKSFKFVQKAVVLKFPCCAMPRLMPHSVRVKQDYSNAPHFVPPPQNSKKIMKLKEKDKVPRDFDLVYQSPISTYLGIAQLTSLVVTSAIAGLAIAFPDAGIQPSEDNVFGPQSSLEGKVAYASLALATYSFFYISMKSPLRIYTDGETFMMAMGHLILGPNGPTRKLTFSAGDAKLDAPFKLSPWNSVRYDINGKKYFIFENNFRTNADFLLMCGLK